MVRYHIEDLIIQNYLQGLSRDEIAKEMNVATGSVTNKKTSGKKE